MNKRVKQVFGILLALLALVLLPSTIRIAGADTTGAFMADMDGDGAVTDSDAIYLLMHTFFPDDYPISGNCDYDQDGVITDSDAIYLLMYTFFPDDYPIDLTDTGEDVPSDTWEGEIDRPE